MKLLLDENLSPRIVGLLADLYPGSAHVRDVRLQSAPDRDIWAYAARNKMAIVSKDNDFRQRSFLSGPPPKVVWIGRGNCSTREILAILRNHRAELEAFERDSSAAFLTLE